MADTDTRSALRPMSFHSILFARPEDTPALATRAPACFADLNLGQIVESITAGRDEYDLKPFFFTALTDVDAIGYRHEVMRDLQRPGLRAHIEAFADAMRTMRQWLDRAAKLHYTYQREIWFVDATQTYAVAVTALARDLGSHELGSRGMQAFREFLSGYASSAALRALVDEAAELKEKLSAVRYCLQIRGSRITVTSYDDQPDYSAEVSATFEKFRQGAAADHLIQLASYLNMNHVEAGILDLVAEIFPETFAGLDAYCARHRDYLN
ncbi:MAG: hypothetical protein Q4P32_12115, partial [Micrococcales bacterium]|nr:hypothetical protein [Micrococcales bacterium]